MDEAARVAVERVNAAVSGVEERTREFLGEPIGRTLALDGDTIFAEQNARNSLIEVRPASGSKPTILLLKPNWATVDLEQVKRALKAAPGCFAVLKPNAPPDATHESILDVFRERNMVVLNLFAVAWLKGKRGKFEQLFNDLWTDENVERYFPRLPQVELLRVRQEDAPARQAEPAQALTPDQQQQLRRDAEAARKQGKSEAVRSWLGREIDRRTTQTKDVYIALCLLRGSEVYLDHLEVRLRRVESALRLKASDLDFRAATVASARPSDPEKTFDAIRKRCSGDLEFFLQSEKAQTNAVFQERLNQIERDLQPDGKKLLKVILEELLTTANKEGERLQKAALDLWKTRIECRIIPTMLEPSRVREAASVEESAAPLKNLERDGEAFDQPVARGPGRLATFWPFWKSRVPTATSAPPPLATNEGEPMPPLADRVPSEGMDNFLISEASSKSAIDELFHQHVGKSISQVPSVTEALNIPKRVISNMGFIGAVFSAGLRVSVRTIATASTILLTLGLSSSTIKLNDIVSGVRNSIGQIGLVAFVFAASIFIVGWAETRNRTRREREINNRKAVEMLRSGMASYLEGWYRRLGEDATTAVESSLRREFIRWRIETFEGSVRRWEEDEGALEDERGHLNDNLRKIEDVFSEIKRVKKFLEKETEVLRKLLLDNVRALSDLLPPSLRGGGP